MSRRTKRDDLTAFIVAVIVILVYLFRINVMKTPYYSDELGYWAAGAWMRGIDWSPIFSRSGYYGWGYGVVLAPLFLIGNSSLRFQMALALNVVMTTGSYAMLISINKKIFPNISKSIISIVSGVAISYSYCIVYAHLTMCECALTFLFLLSIIGVINVCEKKTIKSLLFLSVVLGMQMATHLRAVIFIAAGGAIICFLTFNRKISKKKFILFCIFILATVWIVFFVKERLIISQYTSSDGNITHPEGNDDFLGVLSSLKYLFSFYTYKWLFISCVGKWFYLGCASFFSIWIGMRYLIQNFIMALRNKKYDEQNIVILYISTSFVGAFLLGAWTMTFASRLDQIFYGRYIENVVPIIIGVGLLSLINDGIKAKEILCYVIIALIMSIMLNSFIRQNSFIGALPLENSGFAGIMVRENQDYGMQFTIHAVLITLLGTTVFYFVFKKNTVIGCTLLAVAWIVIAYRGLEICAYRELERQEIMIETAYEVMKTDQKVYMLLPDDDVSGFVDMLYLQFHMGERTMHIVELENLECINKGEWLIVSRRRPDCNEIASRYSSARQKPLIYVIEVQ